MTDDGLSGAVDGIVRGVRARAAQVLRAEEQLAAFAWKEGGQEAATPDGTAGVASMVVRALRSAVEGDTYPLLVDLAEEGDATIAVLAERMGVGRLAAVDRVGAWTQAGLVARDLETDRVGLSALGGGVVQLVRYLAKAAAEGSS